MKCAVIFGGTGFIGSFFADFILNNSDFDKVYVFDIESVDEKTSSFRRSFFKNKNIEFVFGDVRKSINGFSPQEEVSLIANFAAVHREPGHEDREYFETNLLGAENVCMWAENVGCNRIIFTSSISPYGIGEFEKDETSLPVPVSAYGSSKLVAEKIHLNWQSKGSDNRRLIIVRPGVVFGPGEGGNVSRLIKAVLHRYFFYMGNKYTRKSGVYVKELCRALWWVFERQVSVGEFVTLFNMSMNPGPSIQDYVNSVCKVADVKRFIPFVPYKVVIICSYLIVFFASPFGVRHPFSPVRIRKLVRSNNVIPNYLVSNGYKYIYSLDAAFSDWRSSCPDDWS